MSKKIKDEQKKFLGETLNQYDKALDEAINQLDKKNREQNHKISSLVNSFDNEYLEKDVEGNMTALENSKDGMVIINEIQGSTEVNYCKDGEKELILNGDIDTQGESFVTITEGVDGGLVDVSLEGNTEINLSKTKDPVLVTREFDDIDCNIGKLQYTIDDVTTINDEPGKVDIDRIVGDTMVNHAVNGSEELILNAHINESGDNNITLNGVTSDGGKVDVYLEGNTLVNVSNVKDDYITPTIEDKVDQGSVISLPEASEGYINIDEIQGNTLVNYCTDGAKELTLNGDIDVEGNFVTTTEGVDNGLVDVVCEGNTLVNLWNINNIHLSGQCSISGNKITCTTTDNQWSNFFIGDSSLFKPSTDYTFIVNITKNTLDINDTIAITSNSGENNVDIFSKGDLPGFSIKGGVTGLQIKKLTTCSSFEGTTSAVRSFISNDSQVAGHQVELNIVILEGDWTNKEIPQYFEGMKSVGQDDVNGHKVEIVSQNKNLIDINRFSPAINKGTMSIDGDTITFDYKGSYPYIKQIFTQEEINLLKGKTFKFGYGGITDTVENNKLNIRFVAVVDGVDNYYSFPSTENYTRIVTLPDNIESLEFSVVPNNTVADIQGTFTISNMQLLFADTENTNYVKHSSNKKEIPLNEPLRSLPNGTKDRFVKIGGKWFIERNCGSIGFNEIINAVALGDTRKEKTIRFKWKSDVIPNMKPDSTSNFYCNNFKYAKYSDDIEGIDIGKDLDCNILRSRLQTQDINGFKQWVENNPTTVIYELATPTYEPLEIEPVLNTYNEVTYLSNNSIIPCNMQIKNTGYNAIIKPSTLYTVALDTDKSGTVVIDLGGMKTVTTNNVATITTPAILSDDSLRLFGKGIKGSKVRLLEGDKTNWIPRFFEGMKSSFEDEVQEDNSYKIELLMNNKNLIDYNQPIRNNGSVHYEIDRNNSNIVAYSMESSPWQNVQVSLNLSNGKTYTLSYETLEYQSTNGVDVDINYYVAIYETIPNREIAHINYATKNTTFTVPKDVNAKDLGLRIYITQRTSDMATIKVNGLMVTESNQKLDFAPPISNKIQFSSIEPLRGVGDVHDRLVFKDGKLMIERNCKSATFDGSDDEDWWTSSTQVDGYNCYVIRLNDTLIDYHLNEKMLCDKVYVNSNRKLNTIVPLVIDDNTAIGLYYTDSSINVTDFKNKLNLNPITVVYPLATPTYEEIPYDLQKIILESYTNGTLFIDTNIPPTKVSFNCFEEELTYLYPSTSYTVQFMSDRDTTADITLGGTQLLAQNIVQGLNKISITTPSELADSKLLINGAGAKISDVVVTDTNREFKYFEGMKSVGECEGNIEILSQNKNLYPFDRISFATADEFRNATEGQLKLKANTQYSIKIDNITSSTNYCRFGILLLKDGKNITDRSNLVIIKNNMSLIFRRDKYNRLQSSGDIPSSDEKWAIITPNTDCELFIAFHPGVEHDENTSGRIQIEQGSTATDYIPPQSNTQQLTHEPLRAVGDVKDKYVLIDGKWYIERKCASATFDGSDDENWRFHKLESSGKYAYVSGKSLGEYETSIDIISNVKTVNWYNSPWTIAENIISLQHSYGNIYSYSDYINLNDFKSNLNNNPITVIYPLASPIYEPINYNPLEVYSGTTHITTNSVIPCNIIVKNHGYNMVALKENTQYTLYVNKDTTNTLTYRLGDYIEINSPSKFTFTTPETLTDKTLRIDGKGAKVKDLMLIEGIPTNDSIGYFDGLKSSYECEQVTDELDENYGKYKVDIKVVGKNLFDGETRNGYYSSGVFKANANNLANVNPIRIKPNTSYVGSGDAPPRMSFYDKDMNFILNSTSTCNISPSNAYYMNIHAYGATWFQIEEGDTATDYEPYFESKQTIYLNSPLLKGDEIVWKDNKIQHYHKMYKVVLDGSDDEGWNLNKNYSTGGQYVSYESVRDVKPKSDLTIYCDKIKYIGAYDGVNDCIWVYNNLSLVIQNSTIETLEDFRQWLQQNPIKVVYELETPYYEEISDYPLKLNVIANSSLSTESTIQVTNISFNIYEETLPYLYPNTKYYITFNADVDRNNIIIDLGGNHVVFDCKVGFNKVEITTPSDTTNLLTFSGTGVNIDHVKVTQQDIDGYFEGMKSVGECEGNVIEIVSQNNLANIATSGDTNFQVANIRAGVTYSMKCTRSDNTVRYNLRLNDGYGVKLINGTLGDFCTFTPPTNGILYFNAHGSNTITDIMLVEGIYTEDTMPQFKPYTENKKELTHEPLRAVGDYRDRYVLIDGKWYIERKYGKAVLDGSVVSGNVSSYFPSDNSSIFFIKKEDAKSYDNWLACDKFMPNINVSNSENRNVEGIFTSVNGSITAFYFRIFNNKLSTQDINGCKQYLQQNPVTVVYQLATPIYEPIDYNPFETYADVTHITTNSLIPTNVVIKNHGYNCILKPSTKYTIALNKPNGTISAKLGGSAKVDSTNSIFTITTPSTLNDNVLRLSGSGKVKDIMILEGDKTVNTPSYFEGIESGFEQEYDAEKGKYRVTAKVEGNGKKSSIVFYLNEPLRGTNTAKDKVFIQDSKVVVQRNCYELKVNRDCIIHLGNNNYNYNTFMIRLYLCNYGNDFPNASQEFVYCNTIPCVTKNIWGEDKENVVIADLHSQILDFRVNKNKLSSLDIEGFYKWFENNPTTVVYALAEPVYEEADCDLSKLVLENYENSSLIFESNIPVSANIKYSGEVPVVTQAKALSSKVDNTTLDINENIIPYMCDIDYRIVELQLMNGDTQGEGIELLGIGDIEILGNENVLFNNREDKKHNFSYDMLKRDILSQRYSKEEYQYRLDRYLLAKKISDEEYKELEGLLNNGK